MSHPSLNQQTLIDLRRDAKKWSREDPTKTYNQWLNFLCADRFGFATFDSLKRRVEAIEREEAEREERELWLQRFASPMVWSGHWDAENSLEETWPLPVVEGSVCWPNCFACSSLFTCGEGPRRQIDGQVFSLDGPKVRYYGEELRVETDETILMSLISIAGKQPCGRLVEFSCGELDDAIGLPLPEWGMPVQYEEIARTLWRLTHSKLVVENFKFDGPILIHADARRHPERFAIRVNPAFAHFYYPVLTLLA